MKMNHALKKKTAFFIPNGTMHFNSMPMGATNVHAAFVAMISKMEIKWNKLYKSRCKKGKEAEWEWLKKQMESATLEMKKKRAKEEAETEQENIPSPTTESEAFEPVWEPPYETDPRQGSAVIVDDISLFAQAPTILLFFFICMVEILQQKAKHSNQ